MFVGMHDFRAFAVVDKRKRAQDEDEPSTTVLVERLDIAQAGALVLVGIEGSHFLWRMVRRLVGVLVEVGQGALDIDAATALLTNGSDLPARLTAPASGLFLECAYYEGDPRGRPLTAITPVA